MLFGKVQFFGKRENIVPLASKERKVLVRSQEIVGVPGALLDHRVETGTAFRRGCQKFLPPA